MSKTAKPTLEQLNLAALWLESYDPISLEGGGELDPNEDMRPVVAALRRMLFEQRVKEEAERVCQTWEGNRGRIYSRREVAMRLRRELLEQGANPEEASL